MPFGWPAWVWLLILLAFLVGQMVSIYGLMRFFQRRQARRRQAKAHERVRPPQDPAP